MKRMRIKPFEAALLTAFAAALLYSAVLSTARDALADHIVRLRVVANSDSEADQALKIQVRDAVIASLSDSLTGAYDHDSSLAILAENLETAKNAAANVVAGAGYDYDIKAEIIREDFGTRKYTDFTLPAGEYDSLRITIGAGAGKNWWCVVFPALCREVAAAEETEESYAMLTEAERALIADDGSGAAQIKFGFLEWIRKIID